MQLRWLAATSILILTQTGVGLCDDAPVTADAAKSASDDKSPPFEIDAGPDLITGRYGSRRRATLSSLDTKFEWDPFDTTMLSLELPYLVQRAPAGTIAGRAHRAHVGGGKDVTTDGIGDLNLAVDQTLAEQSNKVPLTVGLDGNLKLGTASVSKGLGSGETDYTGQIHVARTIEKALIEIRGGYAFLGSPGHVTVDDISENVHYRNIWLGSLLGAYEVSHAFTIGGAFDSSRSSEKHFGPANDISANASYQILSHIGLRAAILRGLTNSSPDWGASLLLFAAL